jgi:hypothetical protein
MLAQYKGTYFESSSYATPEFNGFARTTKSELRKELTSYGLELAGYNKGHFEISGFILNTRTGKLAYYSIGDVRPTFTGNGVLYRTAEHNRDYTGGMNQFCEIDELAENLERITR